MLKKSWVLVGNPEGVGNRPWTRYQFAVASMATTHHLTNIAKGLMFGPPEVRTQDSGADIQRVSGAFKILPPLIRHFSPEIKEIGGNPEELLGELADDKLSIDNALASRLPELQQNPAAQFPDVPKGHWAYKAVLDLRTLGILDGYPDRKFRG